MLMTMISKKFFREGKEIRNQMGQKHSACFFVVGFESDFGDSLTERLWYIPPPVALRSSHACGRKQTDVGKYDSLTYSWMLPMKGEVTSVLFFLFNLIL